MIKLIRFNEVPERYRQKLLRYAKDIPIPANLCSSNYDSPTLLAFHNHGSSLLLKCHGTQGWKFNNRNSANYTTLNNAPIDPETLCWITSMTPKLLDYLMTYKKLHRK